ncbi:hypothetical protein EZV62_008880 [Acer yangbiense]|uniref:Uncharacterized protein n=1 Tax=Acer yangbiense TaxID=1000413 RepID=A0A5C7IF20_9ROSI|nr:hypothetical protein EZV62_008880 [Acer yangbiense]
MVQILGKDELPSLNGVISMVRAEENRRGVMLQPSPLEGLAMVSTDGNRNSLKLDQPTNDNGRTDFPKPSNCDNLWCTYCKRPRHTKDRCWKLIGKPSTSSKEWGYKGGQSRNQGHAHMTSAHKDGELNMEAIEKLKDLLGSLENNDLPLVIKDVVATGDTGLQPTFTEAVLESNTNSGPNTASPVPTNSESTNTEPINASDGVLNPMKEV